MAGKENCEFGNEDCGFDGNDNSKKKKRAKGKKKGKKKWPGLRPIEEWLLDYHVMFNPNDFVVHYCPRCGTPPKVFRQLLIELADRTGEDLCLPREEVCMLCNLNLERVCVFGNDPEPDCLDLNDE